MVQTRSQTVPGPAQWRRECRDVLYAVTETIYETVMTTEKVPSRVCKPVVRNVCRKVTLPRFDVITEDKKETVTVMVTVCK